MKKCKSKKKSSLLAVVPWIPMVALAITLNVAGPISAQAQEEFKYGAIMPVTGAIPQFGEYFVRGSQLAMEDLEKSGWITGKKIRIVLEDGKNDPKVSLAGLNKLISIDKVPIVESLGSSVVLSLGPVCQKNGVVLSNVAAQNPNVRKIGNYIFSLVPLADTVMQVTTNWAINGLKAKKAALLYVNYEFGRGTANSFAEEFKKQGGEIVATEIFPDGQADFTSNMTKLKFVNADLIFYVGNENELGYALKKAKQMGVKGRWLCAPGVLNPATFAIAGEAANGLQAADYRFDPENGTEVMKAFGERYKARFGVLPGFSAARSYDSIMLYASALKAGATTAEKLRDYYLSMKTFTGSISGPISFDKDGITQEQPVIKEVRDGHTFLVQ